MCSHQESEAPPPAAWLANGLIKIHDVISSPGPVGLSLWESTGHRWPPGGTSKPRMQGHRLGLQPCLERKTTDFSLQTWNCLLDVAPSSCPAPSIFSPVSVPLDLRLFLPQEDIAGSCVAPRGRTGTSWVRVPFPWGRREPAFPACHSLPSPREDSEPGGPGVAVQASLGTVGSELCREPRLVAVPSGDPAGPS